MALFGPDSSQIAREVWAERRGRRQEQGYVSEEGGSHLFAISIGSCLLRGGGAPTVALQWSVNLRAPWRETASVILPPAPKLLRDARC